MRSTEKPRPWTPNSADLHYNIGTLLSNMGKCNAAVPELREAKRLDPSRFDIRMNLGYALYSCNLYSQSVKEYRELVSLFPNAAPAHSMLGNAYLLSGNNPAAETEYRTAAELDPHDAEPLLRLGELFEKQQKYDEALAAFQLAAKADVKSAEAHADVGRMLLVKKDYVAALREFKRGEELNPGDGTIHDLYARALQATGADDQAIDEFRQAVALAPSNLQSQIRLATALEKKGHWVAAMEQYRKAATVDAGSGLGPKIVHRYDRDPQKEYSAAQARFQAHLTALKAAGKSAEASKLESAVDASQLNASDSAKLDAAMQAGFAAARDRRPNDALQHYKEAVDIAEKMKTRDGRLSEALGELGKITLGFRRFDDANAIFQRQLQVVEETAGPGSPEMIEPLENMGMNAMYKGDYEASRAYLTRLLELARTNYGETNSKVASGLHKMALTYFNQQDHADAEAWLLRAVKIDDEIDGYDGFQGSADVNMLCVVYDRAGKVDKAAGCYAKMAEITARQFSAENPVVALPLTSEVKALRSLGRNEEAAKIEQRIKALQASASNQN